MILFFSPRKSHVPAPNCSVFGKQDREMAIHEKRAACSHGSDISPGWPWAALQQRCSSQSSQEEDVIQQGHIHAAHAGLGSAPAVPRSTGRALWQQVGAPETWKRGVTSKLQQALTRAKSSPRESAAKVFVSRRVYGQNCGSLEVYFGNLLSTSGLS